MSFFYQFISVLLLGLGVSISLLIGKSYFIKADSLNTKFTIENSGNFKSKPSEIKTDYDNEENKIEAVAKAITIKVLSGQNTGSGILIHKQNNTYTILTNHHVLVFGQTDNSYQIQTSDGSVYPAQAITDINLRDYDLGLLRFVSDQNYAVTALNHRYETKIGEEVYTAGFPFVPNDNKSSKLSITKGTVEMKPPIAFGGGYQLGYTNSIKKGMSGGPILNNQGQLIGINGRHKYPLWGNPYIFADGRTASSQERERMNQLSWGIPLKAFSDLAPQFNNQQTLEFIK